MYGNQPERIAAMHAKKHHLRAHTQDINNPETIH